MIVVLMGVSGSGKTTIGTLLAERTGAIFADADDYHPLANKQKMAAGHALDDIDRQPWLEELNRLMRGWNVARKRGVLACSALKETYRTTLATNLPCDGLQFVLLEGPRELIAERLATRKNHYMGPQLLDSQLRTLEPPADAFAIVNDRAPAAVVDSILAHLGAVKSSQRDE